MNNLALIMESKGITTKELAKLSGCDAGNIRRLMKLDSLDFIRSDTKKRIATALGVTPRELVKGGKRMKNKVLYAEIVKATENLANALRNYTDAPMYLDLCIMTRDDSIRCEGDPIGVPDYYSIRCHKADDIDEIVPDISESARVFYSEDGNGEGIRNVFKYHDEVASNDLQRRTQQ